MMTDMIQYLFAYSDLISYVNNVGLLAADLRRNIFRNANKVRSTVNDCQSSALITYVYHVMIIVTGGISKKLLLLLLFPGNSFELLTLLQNIQNKFDLFLFVLFSLVD